MKTKRFCLTLDLKDSPKLIAEYRMHHEKIWPEVYQSIKDAGIKVMEIYLFSNRLFMIMETEDDFSFEKKAAADANNPKILEWEKLMLNYQEPLPGSKSGEKWKIMERIFTL
jgi:L-rhamnose mutarotase